MSALFALLLAVQPADERVVARPLVDVIERLGAPDSPLHFERTKCQAQTCLGTLSDGEGNHASLSLQQVAPERTIVRARGDEAPVQSLWQLLEPVVMVPAEVRPPAAEGVRVFVGRDPHAPPPPVVPLAWFYVDVFSGFTGPQDTHTHSAMNGASVDARLDPGLALGMRSGFWLGRAPYVGAAIDVTYLHQSGEGTTFDFVPISLLGTVRVQFERVSPQLSMGVALMPGKVEADPMVTSTSVFGIGFDVRLGVPVQLTDTVSVFGEWRWLKASPEAGQDGVVAVAVDTTFEVSQFIFGISLNLH